MAKKKDYNLPHLTGRGGIGKGSQRRRGADEAAFRRAVWPPESPNLRPKNERAQNTETSQVSTVNAGAYSSADGCSEEHEGERGNL